MNAKMLSSLELMRFGRSMKSALLVLPLSWRVSHYVVFLVFLLFSFAFNDLVDREMDKDGHPERPLPSGRISAMEAGTISLCLLFAGVCFAYVWAEDLLKLFVCASGVSAVYSWILKRHVPLIATPLWALTVTTIVCLPAKITVTGWLVFFLVLYIHEVLLDMRDVEADRIHCSTPSIATLLGKYCWWYVLFLLLTFSSVFELGYAMEIAAGSVETFLWSTLIQNAMVVFFLLMLYEIFMSDEEQTDWVAMGIKNLKRILPVSVLLV